MFIFWKKKDNIKDNHIRERRKMPINRLIEIPAKCAKMHKRDKGGIKRAVNPNKKIAKEDI